MKRLDARQRKRKRDGSPFVELERIYKAELELVRAQLRSEEAEGSTHNAEANMLAQQCRLLRLGLQNAKTEIVPSAHCCASMVCVSERVLKRSVLRSPVGYDDHLRRFGLV